MRNIYKIFAFTAIAGFLFALTPVKDSSAAAGDCTASVQFNSVKSPASFNQPVTFSSTVHLSNFINGGADDGFCQYSGPLGSSFVYRTIYIYYDFGSAPSLNKIPPTSIIGSKFKVSTINLAKNNPAINDSVSITPSEFGFKDGDTMDVKIYVMYCGNLLGQSVCGIDLARSSTQSVKLAAGTYKIYACVAGNGNYACSANGKNYSDCSGVPNKSSVCGANSCVNIDSNLCDKPAQNTHKGCLNNSCTAVPGAGSDTCTTDADCTGTGGGTTTQKFEIRNPIGVENFQDLINIIGKWIFNLAIPIAVIIIIYAGVLMLTSGGQPARFQSGAKALWYAVIGLAVVLIGKGFVTLVQSILSLRK